MLHAKSQELLIRLLHLLYLISLKCQFYNQHIVPICFNFWSPKVAFCKNLAQKLRLVSTKRNFVSKVAFYNCARMRIPNMDLIRSILQKSLGVLGYPLGVSWQLPNCPSNAHVFRDAQCLHSSHLISLLCAKPAPSFLSSSCCYKPLLAHKSPFSFVTR